MRDQQLFERWVLKHGIRTTTIPHPSDAGDVLWTAHRVQDEQADGTPRPGFQGTGDTEKGAILALADRLVLPLWDETPM